MAALFAQPTDVQLLEEYLRPYVETGKSPSPLFHGADIYSAHPEDLASEYAPVTSRDGATRWYFFTALREKSIRDSRTRRRVASGGSWQGEHREKPVRAGEGGAKIGYQQTFSFCRKENGKLLRLGWIMSEVGFCDGGGHGTRVVVCRVYRSPRTAPAPAPGTADGLRGANEMAGHAPPRARTAEEPRAGGARTAEGPQGGCQSEVAGAARIEEGQRAGSESEVAGSAASAGCSCGQDLREILRLEHSAARSAKAPGKVFLLAQVEVGDGEASPDDFLVHNLCKIEWIGATEGFGSMRKRKREERSGWMVLCPAKAAVVPNAVSCSCSHSRCGEPLALSP